MRDATPTGQPVTKIALEVLARSTRVAGLRRGITFFGFANFLRDWTRAANFSQVYVYSRAREGKTLKYLL